MRKDATTSLERELLNALAFLVEQVKEDCPIEYRTKHLDTAIEDALCILPTKDEEDE